MKKKTYLPRKKVIETKLPVSEECYTVIGNLLRENNMNIKPVYIEGYIEVYADNGFQLVVDWSNFSMKLISGPYLK